jgi:hypothetical protein
MFCQHNLYYKEIIGRDMTGENGNGYGVIEVKNINALIHVVRMGSTVHRFHVNRHIFWD